MSFQEEETTMEDAIYIGKLPNGDLYVGTEPPVGGFATDAGEGIMEDQFQGLAVEEPQNPLSGLPQNINECFDHPMWDLSKKCVVCCVREMRGGIACNPSLFGYFNCGCIRACSEHYDAVSSYFEKPEFKGKIVHPNGDNYEVRRCPQCCKNFNSRVDNQNQYCDKGCQGNWLDCRFA